MPHLKQESPVTHRVSLSCVFRAKRWLTLKIHFYHILWFILLWCVWLEHGVKLNSMQLWRIPVYLYRLQSRIIVIVITILHTSELFTKVHTSVSIRFDQLEGPWRDWVSTEYVEPIILKPSTKSDKRNVDRDKRMRSEENKTVISMIKYYMDILHTRNEYKCNYKLAEKLFGMLKKIRIFTYFICTKKCQKQFSKISSKFHRRLKRSGK